jgi:hypothetical protein
MTVQPNPPCGQPWLMHPADRAGDHQQPVNLRSAIRDHDGPAGSYVACCEPSPSRWSAFTDDELDELLGWAGWVEIGLNEAGDRIEAEIQAEIERRQEPCGATDEA